MYILLFGRNAYKSNCESKIYAPPLRYDAKKLIIYLKLKNLALFLLCKVYLNKFLLSIENLSTLSVRWITFKLNFIIN